jgi:DNA adenine methylase
MMSTTQLDLDFCDGRSTFSEVCSVPSLIKWTGSKRSQVSYISSIMPKYRRYFEPFLGGGALLYIAATPASVASDIYRPLIKLWDLIQRSPAKVIENYRAQFNALTSELDELDLEKLPTDKKLPAYFYKVRDRFNLTSDPLDLNFIMRTCVNGIVRFNDKGAFNNSFHLSRRGMEPARFDRVVRSWHQAIRGVEFLCQDYALTLDLAQKEDFVYLDPPYAGNKQRYVGNLDLIRFFTQLDQLNRRGVKWALSFDGQRGDVSLFHDIPKSLFKRHMLLRSGNSAVSKVLNGPVEMVRESLYLNY